MLTDEQRKKYLDNGGNNCPYCEGDSLSSDYMQVDGEGAWRRVDCLNPKCLQKWTEVYKLVDVEE